MQKIVPCLWFDTQAEEAAKFYTSVFPNSKIKQVTHYGEAASKAAGLPVGTVLTVTFDLNGQPHMGLNGGPAFHFSEAISLMVQCDTQEEIDRYWSALTADGGQESVCGWLKDKYGLSWQIVPTLLDELRDDPAAANRVMAAVVKMKKLDLAELKRAAEGK